MLKYPWSPRKGPEKIRSKPFYHETDADPLIRGREKQWLVCIETYQFEKRLQIGRYLLDYDDFETSVYATTEGKAIIGFRGTKEAKDLYDDILIIGGQEFPRVQEAIKFVRNLISLNPNYTFELTGHSLGGAIARETGKVLNLQSTTFNSAAPPSSPVENNPTEVAYHIVFDIVSAWQNPNCVRIDKGYRAVSPILGTFIPQIWFALLLSQIIPAHGLENFTNRIPGTLKSACEENKRFKTWTNNMPISLRSYLIVNLSGGFTESLPSII